MATPSGGDQAPGPGAGVPAEAPPGAALEPPSPKCSLCEGDLEATMGYCRHCGACNPAPSIEPSNRSASLLVLLWECFLQQVTGALANIWTDKLGGFGVILGKSEPGETFLTDLPVVSCAPTWSARDHTWGSDPAQYLYHQANDLTHHAVFRQACRADGGGEVLLPPLGR